MNEHIYSFMLHAVAIVLGSLISVVAFVLIEKFFQSKDE